MSCDFGSFGTGVDSGELYYCDQKNLLYHNLSYTHTCFAIWSICTYLLYEILTWIDFCGHDSSCRTQVYPSRTISLSWLHRVASLLPCSVGLGVDMVVFVVLFSVCGLNWNSSSRQGRVTSSVVLLSSGSRTGS